MELNYSPNFIKKGEDFTAFWKEYLCQNKKILFVLGLGFDPRALHCLEIIHNSNTNAIFDYMVIQYSDNLSYGSQSTMGMLLKHNEDKLEAIVSRELWNVKPIRVRAKNDNTMSIDAAKCISSPDLKKYTDVVVDVSAMPIGVYFPIMRQMLKHSKTVAGSDEKTLNCHLVISENAKLDALINETASREKATIMYQFRGHLQSESKKSLPRIWIPVLGENRQSQLEKIRVEVSPSETSPVFPMPTTDPYRSRDLLLEYKKFLLDTLEIDPSNFIYSSEYNPFETYRKICETAHRSYASFKELGGCQIVLSPLSSKLLCVGCLLAACDLLDNGPDVGVVHVENLAYDFGTNLEIDKNQQDAIPFTLWLAGECYDK